jgi:hypothetical protein
MPCSICKRQGHNKRTCEKRFEKREKEMTGQEDDSFDKTVELYCGEDCFSEQAQDFVVEHNEFRFFSNSCDEIIGERDDEHEWERSLLLKLKL